MAGVGAWAQDKAEPLIPDALDQGERPFIQPFMTRMASAHYALDVSRAHTLLGWQPKHRPADEPPAIVPTPKEDPAAWYKTTQLPAPPFVSTPAQTGPDP